MSSLSPLDATLNKYSLEYQYAELSQATCNFSASQVLGSGSFGKVYLGVQGDGTDVAIKVLDLPESSGFMEEVRVLSKFRHPNLVTLMGFGRHGSQRFLVYELLGGGDVFHRLRKSCSRECGFSWQQRISVAFDAACGLSHLHNCKPKVFHRDIKSANILLDRNGNAKMADFGLACLSNSAMHCVPETTGTLGYADPLYVRRRIVTEGSEVYSFGMVLLELITALPPATEVQKPGGHRGYTFLASKINNNSHMVLKMADPTAEWPLHMSKMMADLALSSIQPSEDLRPGFRAIVNLLRSGRDLQEPFMEVHGTSEQGGASAPPVLWSLECAAAGELDLTFLQRQERTISHSQEHNKASLATFCLGRLIQDNFFETVLPVLHLRSAISREHLQIWAQEVQAESEVDDNITGTPCRIFLSNCSVNGTIVNGRHLHGPGDQVQIHDGDVISLPHVRHTEDGPKIMPLLTFVFSLSGSMLHDIDAFTCVQLQEAVSEKACITAVIDSPRPASPLLVFDPMSSHASSDLGSSDATRCPEDVGNATPSFSLEVGGPGLRLGALPEKCRLVHGPFPGKDCTPDLLLGRSEQPDFWKRVLCRKAYEMLSRSHFKFEFSSQDGTVYVENLAERKEVVIFNSKEDATAQQAIVLRTHGRRQLRQGDVLILNPCRDYFVWLFYLDGADCAHADVPREALLLSSTDICSSFPKASPRLARHGGA